MSRKAHMYLFTTDVHKVLLLQLEYNSRTAILG